MMKIGSYVYVARHPHFGAAILEEYLEEWWDGYVNIRFMNDGSAGRLYRFPVSALVLV